MLKQKIKSRIILIGYKSFLQENLYKYLKKKYLVKKIRFTNINKFNYKKNDIVVNFSNNVNFYNKKYNTKIDRNYRIAKIIKNFNSKLIFISTRQVYKPQINITEKSKIQPMNVYAKNCLISEKKCKNLLSNNILILRLSNVVGLENGRKKKPSLMSLIISGLKKKQIIFDNSYNLYKDLLPIEVFCIILEKLINLNYKGIINIGSGIPIKTKFFLNNIIEAKKIKIIINLKKKFTDDNFCFDTKVLNNIIGRNITKKKLFIYFKKLKKELKKI